MVLEHGLYPTCKTEMKCIRNIIIKIYDVPMMFARKLIHGGPVHHCYEPVEALQQCNHFRLEHWNKKKIKQKKQAGTKLKGRALHWPNLLSSHYQKKYSTTWHALEIISFYCTILDQLLSRLEATVIFLAWQKLEQLCNRLLKGYNLTLVGEIYSDRKGNQSHYISCHVI